MTSYTRRFHSPAPSVATLATAAVIAAVCLLPGAHARDTTTAPPRLTDVEHARALRHSPLPAPPPDPTNEVADDPRAALLGQYLFFDEAYASNGAVSCATCHDPAKQFADGVQLPETIALGSRHTPSLWNVAHNRWFFWDGRTDSLWSQALGPIENPVEMGSSRLRIAHRIADDTALRTAYVNIFGALPPLEDASRFPPTAAPVPGDPESELARAWDAMAPADRDAIDRVFANIGKSIAAYERRLVTRSAPFDDYIADIRRDPAAPSSAISPAAIRGLQMFLGRGECRTCHTGPNFTDGEFHGIGVPPLVGELPRDAGRFDGIPLVQSDRFNTAGEHSADRDGPRAALTRSLAHGPESWGRFKTPSLRNVMRTEPYMHQGQFPTIHDVLHFYSTFEGAVQLDHHAELVLAPLHLSVDEMEDLIAFLDTLTADEIDPELLAQPPSPVWIETSGRKTPLHAGDSEN